MKVRINGIEYDLTNMSIMWDNEFNDYKEDNVIDVSKLELGDKYKATNNMFNHIYNDIMPLAMYDDNNNDKFSVFGGKIREIDQLQQFLFEKNKIEEATKYLEDGITYMLNFYKELLNKDVEKQR